MMIEGWEKEVGGKLEFVPETKAIIEKTIETITKGRKALGITEYAPGKFGAEKVLMDMTDRRKLEDEQKKAAAAK
jgi:carbon-monoxide dehydrogenase catalytic subunit